MQVQLTMASSNKKTGPMPVSMTDSTSCPPSCPLINKGCYAKAGPMVWVWRKVTEGGIGTDWATFCAKIAKLPRGQFWRHNQAGDLPGVGDAIDREALDQLVDANRGRNGFTYTHKPVDGRTKQAKVNRAAVADANRRGLVVNLSANTLAEADKMSDLDIGPVVVIQDATHGERHDTVTPAGRRVSTCPATYRDDVTCASCLLCARSNRKVIVGFPAHGMQTKAARAVASTRNVAKGA